MTDKPIPWNEVAYLAFDGDRPCLICSAEPRVLFETLCSLIDEDESEVDPWRDAETDREKVVDKMREFRWELHKTEDAKRIFCDSIAELRMNQPSLQRSLFGEET